MGDAVDGNRTVGEGTIPVRAGRSAYRIVNPEAPGIPLLALHGGPGATHDYPEPLETLADRRPVVLYDQLGGGNSDRPRPVAVDARAFRGGARDGARSLGLRVCLLGQSWGAMLAVDYLLSRRPEGVACLILSGPCLSASRWAADQRRYLSLLPEQTQADIAECEDAEDFSSPRYLDAMMAFYRRHLCRMEPWPECLNRTFERMGRGVYEHMWGPSEFTIRGSLKRFEGAERLGELRRPALFTCGRFDEAAPATTAFYHRMLPGSELAVLEEASHNHHLEKTGEYLALVRGLLDRVDPPLIRGQRLRPRPPLP